MALNIESMRIRVTTKFDCTATGITGHYRDGRLPIIDKFGKKIINEQQWNQARNQQRNFESLIQLVSLFTQPLNVTQPIYNIDKKAWIFDFDIEYQSVFDHNNDKLGLLKKHCQGIPMILGLNETDVEINIIKPDENIEFELIEI